MKTHLKTLAATFASSVVFLSASTPASLAADLPTQSPDSVVELFTSQGCSSCPPANKFVTSLKDEAELLTLTYGVTYWDYLGWKDTFASPEFTKRQRAYGEAFDTPNVYTPQIVLNGSAHSARYTRQDVNSMPLSISRPTITLGEEGGALTYAIDHNADFKTILISFTPGVQEVPVQRGENGGRTLTLSNVVTDITPLSGPGTTNVKIEPGQSYAVLAHDPSSSKIVTAAVYSP